MNIKEKYAYLWGEDSKELYSKGLYDWMAENINEYKNILEVGCGIGFSTLSLLKKNHNVVSIEFNDFCINKTEDLVKEKGYNNFKIIKYNISESNCLNILKEINQKINIIICWNPGGANSLSNVEKIAVLKDLQTLGYLEPENGFYNNYSENLIRSACKLGQKLNVDVHIIDRDDNKDRVISDYMNIEEYGFKNLIFKQKEK